MRATREQWLLAQQEERKQHIFEMEEGLLHYAEGYRQYFEHLGIEADQKNKRVIEIGCADFPALHFCKNYIGIVIEPMPTHILRKLVSKNGILLIASPAEETDFPIVDEIWLFNVLQHVIDPDSIIVRAKEASKIVRFFEPVGTPLDKCHLHSFNLDYFRHHFGINTVKHYIAKEDVRNFHTCDCAYGVWTEK